jgi:hypothetical protein
VSSKDRSTTVGTGAALLVARRQVFMILDAWFYSAKRVASAGYGNEFSPVEAAFPRSTRTGGSVG